MRRQWSCLAALLWLLGSCVEPYDPGLMGKKKYLVFEGTLTDAPGPYLFALSYSAGYNSNESVYSEIVEGAQVWVTDDAGQIIPFTNGPKGTFYSPSDFRGQLGRRYRLHISHQGQEYESETEIMVPVPDVDTVYAVYQPTVAPGSSNGSFQVYLDVKDPADAKNYYQWYWKHYEAANFCQLYKDASTTYAQQCCEDCWNVTPNLGQLILASDQFVNGNTLKQPLASIPYDDVTPYYLEINQYSISAGAFRFWQTVQALTGNVGGIFDSAPATLTGNIRHMVDPEGLILGYFQVSARRRKIVYINRYGVPVRPFPKVDYPFWSECKPCQESLYQTAQKPEGWQ